MLFLGTSSYSFKEWEGSFYPPKTPPSRYLSYYSSRLNTVEINYTYHHFPTEKLTAAWAEQTPEAFQFSLHMNQSITHVARLKNVEGPLQDFLRNLKPLGPRLGVILLQLPPYFPADLSRLDGVLSQLPADRKFAFEFRHPSWNSPTITDRLRKAGAALCISETEILDRLPPPTAPHAYIRVRKPPPYSEEELHLLRKQIRDLASEVKDLYVYIKHDEAGLAPQVALDFQPLGEYFGRPKRRRKEVIVKE